MGVMEQCLSHRRLVLADDEPDVLASLGELFAASGRWTIAAAVTSGDDLIAAIDEHCPDVVLTDLNMPGGDITLIERLGSTPDRPLVVVLSASVGASLLRKLRAAGADLVLRKGIDSPLISVEQLWADLRTA